ncbi:succinylglutamate desuccinylase/aspartoacylase family protein [Ramlibacter sp.]|uniref:succinylglutamate desuccinylase/aspartoacylase family protein n=1 Tax=Ramlibacter sp. TaxID=1917967 RepID=UPI00261B4459|nr:succinylglutamate desuccinylase/aspartoacylase family protein [Ramlibacter sp.]MDB5953836.1 succinylglutamate desuccinylase/aspartoacylase [Ramlibacter sp.]
MSSGTQVKSQVGTEINFERDGIQTGCLSVPYSHDRDAYGYIPVPLMVARNGEGPTVFLSGANHGDEYEGSIAIMHLMRELKLEHLRGRLILIPALNFPAYLNGTRTSPVDGGNLNRLFPGDPNGTPTQMIAHYIETELMPKADYIVDFHAGGTTMDYLPMLFVNRPKDAAASDRTEQLIEAFGAPRVMYMDEIETEVMISSAARKNQTFFATGEFGGKGTVSKEGLAIVERGIRGLLATLGVVPALAPKDRPAPSRRYSFRTENYIFALVPGIFEPTFELGDEVRADDLAGYIHDPYRPWAEPERVLFRANGLAVMKRTLARVDAGTCLGHLAQEENR